MKWKINSDQSFYDIMQTINYVQKGYVYEDYIYENVENKKQYKNKGVIQLYIKYYNMYKNTSCEECRKKYMKIIQRKIEKLL